VLPTGAAVIILEKSGALRALHYFQLEGMLAVPVTERFGRSGGKAGEEPAHPPSIYPRKAERERGVMVYIYTTGEDYPDFQENQNHPAPVEFAF
jgi:hypothetical protein